MLQQCACNKAPELSQRQLCDDHRMTYLHQQGLLICYAAVFQQCLHQVAGVPVLSIADCIAAKECCQLATMVLRTMLQYALSHMMPEAVAAQVTSVYEQLIEKPPSRFLAAIKLQQATEDAAAEAMACKLCGRSRDLLSDESAATVTQLRDHFLQHIIRIGRLCCLHDMTLKLLCQLRAFLLAQDFQGRLNQAATTRMASQVPNLSTESREKITLGVTSLQQ